MVVRMEPITINGKEDFFGKINEGNLIKVYLGEDTCGSIVYEGMFKEPNEEHSLRFIEQRDEGVLINSLGSKFGDLRFDENGLKIDLENESLITYDPDDPSEYWGKAYALLITAGKWKGKLGIK